MIKIREYQEKDKGQVKELIKTILKEIFKKEPRKLEDLDDIKTNYDLFLIAKDGNKIVGTVGIMSKNNLGLLRRMFVKKEYRRGGIAQRLYDEVERYCKKSELKSIMLSTNAKMKIAINFYRKNSFIVERVKKDRIFMKKNLK
jgi:N-acetylglutamate synthase-like GNAT family acetyltransferase